MHKPSIKVTFRTNHLVTEPDIEPEYSHLTRNVLHLCRKYAATETATPYSAIGYG